MVFTKNFKTMNKPMIAALMAGTLTACGGGGGSTPKTPVDPPVQPPVNEAPVVSLDEVSPAYNGESITLNASATDDNGVPTLTYSTNLGDLESNVLVCEKGLTTATVTATDSEGLTDSASVDVPCNLNDDDKNQIALNNGFTLGGVPVLGQTPKFTFNNGANQKFAIVPNLTGEQIGDFNSNSDSPNPDSANKIFAPLGDFTTSSGFEAALDTIKGENGAPLEILSAPITIEGESFSQSISCINNANGLLACETDGPGFKLGSKVDSVTCSTDGDDTLEIARTSITDDGVSTYSINSEFVGDNFNSGVSKLNSCVAKNGGLENSLSHGIRVSINAAEGPSIVGSITGGISNQGGSVPEYTPATIVASATDSNGIVIVNNEETGESIVTDCMFDETVVENIDISQTYSLQGVSNVSCSITATDSNGNTSTETVLPLEVSPLTITQDGPGSFNGTEETIVEGYSPSSISLNDASFSVSERDSEYLEGDNLETLVNGDGASNPINTENLEIGNSIATQRETYTCRDEAVTAGICFPGFSKEIETEDSYTIVKEEEELSATFDFSGNDRVNGNIRAGKPSSFTGSVVNQREQPANGVVTYTSSVDSGEELSTDGTVVTASNSTSLEVRAFENGILVGSSGVIELHPNGNPILSGYENQTCDSGDTVTLAGSIFDPEGDTVTLEHIINGISRGENNTLTCPETAIEYSVIGRDEFGGETTTPNYTITPNETEPEPTPVTIDDIGSFDGSTSIVNTASQPNYTFTIPTCSGGDGRYTVTLNVTNETNPERNTVFENRMPGSTQYIGFAPNVDLDLEVYTATCNSNGESSEGVTKTLDIGVRF